MTPDQEAEYLIFARGRSPGLFRGALLLTGGDWHRSADLTQETLGRMYEIWDRKHPIDQPAGYAHTVMARIFLAHRRRKSSQERPVDQLPEAAFTQPDITRQLLLLQSLNRLSRNDRAVLMLRFYGDLSVEDVADRLHRTPGAIRVQTHRALTRLRAELGPDLRELPLS
ncbi:RNA polymerase sigma factor (sigma-70 family) [Nakamurella sp. UYEF19]|uniref:sigma-70 family RNA polymerase sigma factor n=1 Tax=Nakamurella sp. UYEF19 TaxID=1756392 RepID=UPI00339211C8